MARSRNPLKTAAKRSFARATGIPTTKSGRKRKALNTITGGGYGKYKRTQTTIRKLTGTSRRSKSTGCVMPVLFVIAACMIISSFL